jgi:succinate dehydrogenase/fumarate reductase-like Fe-S protein
MVEASKSRMINVDVQRFDPQTDSEPRFQRYEVPTEEGWTALTVLRYIYENLDSTLAFYSSCRLGKCAGCDSIVNGKLRFTCTYQVNGDLRIEPTKTYALVRDLFVDKSKRLRGAGGSEDEEGE